MKQNIYIYIIGIVLAAVFNSCADDESFSLSSSDILSFTTDTVKLDTTFSNVPTVTKSFWAFNRSRAGLKISNVRLENGNQSGYRVNVNGTYLGEKAGFQDHDIEIRKGDSIRVFVELTSATQYQDEPKLVEDNLIFTLESGVQQKINLNAYSWDAVLLNSPRFSADTTLSSSKPMVIYGGMYVDSATTLTVKPGVTLYFHENAGLHVYGKLITKGTAEKNVVLRGDRIDHMFDYLPYDRTPGQWRGIHFYSSSVDNHLEFTDIHSAYDGVVCDSTGVDTTKLSIIQSTIHNCQGYGLAVYDSKVFLENSLFSNTLQDCAFFSGGNADINHCTFAQFYLFTAKRGSAFSFNSKNYSLVNLNVRNSLITGRASDEMMGTPGDTTQFNYQFDHCIIRTPKITTADSVHFTHVIYEELKDTTKFGQYHFRTFDTKNLIFDFRLKKTSAAVDALGTATLPYDRNGVLRDDKPDIGCFEYKE